MEENPVVEQKIEMEAFRLIQILSSWSTESPLYEENTNSQGEVQKWVDRNDAELLAAMKI